MESLRMSIWHEAVPKYQVNEGTRNSGFAQSCTYANTLFLSRANLPGLGKNWVKLDFFLELAYPWHCVFTMLKVGRFFQKLPLRLLPNITFLLDYLFFLPSTTTAAHTTTFSVIFPSSRGQWHLFACFYQSQLKHSLVTKKAFKTSVFYFFHIKVLFTSW